MLDMKKGTKKGQVERRKHPRRTAKTAAVGEKRDARREKLDRSLRDSSALSATHEHCTNCGKGLAKEDRALFVEEDVGRVFCSEDCITQSFQGEIEAIEKEYYKYRPKDDLTPEEREQYAHLRWITIQEPDEVWRERRPSGDSRYTLISEFKPGSKPVWCVCICLFLRGEPSFLYMAFPTRSRALVERFRKGKLVDLEATRKEAVAGAHPEAAEGSEENSPESGRTDGLADGWSQSETLRAEIYRHRDANDIPQEEYGLYENLMEKTLEEPDELWVVDSKDDGEPDQYHFIREFPDEDGGPVTYIIVAQESEQAEQLEVVDQFPTRNEELVKHHRQGRQELLTVGEDDSASKTIH
jgi:hypothetical protein